MRSTVNFSIADGAHPRTFVLLLLAVVLSASVGCGEDEEATVNLTVEPQNAAPGASIRVTIDSRQEGVQSETLTYLEAQSNEGWEPAHVLQSGGRQPEILPIGPGEPVALADGLSAGQTETLKLPRSLPVGEYRLRKRYVAPSQNPADVTAALTVEQGQ